MKIEDYEKLLWKKYKQSNDPEIEERYRHSLGVAKKALELIERFKLNVDPEKAAIAGILHDYAKFEKPERYREVVHKYNLDPQILDKSPKILHALLGPYIIKEEVGVEDEEILKAVQTHTTGSLDMSELAEVIFLADYTDETREGPYFDEVKRLSQIDFYQAIRQKLKQRLAKHHDEKTQKIYQKYLEVKCK
ncbi:MAG: HD domain-containing protein [Acholeplasmataceae bacterium]|nr:HD domain-containing protein [Acholeplasmataceae bacterium]